MIFSQISQLKVDLGIQLFDLGLSFKYRTLMKVENLCQEISVKKFQPSNTRYTWTNGRRIGRDYHIRMRPNEVVTISRSHPDQTTPTALYEIRFEGKGSMRGILGSISNLIFTTHWRYLFIVYSQFAPISSQRDLGDLVNSHGQGFWWKSDQFSASLYRDDAALNYFTFYWCQFTCNARRHSDRRHLNLKAFLLQGINYNRHQLQKVDGHPTVFVKDSWRSLYLGLSAVDVNFPLLTLWCFQQFRLILTHN